MKSLMWSLLLTCFVKEVKCLNDVRLRFGGSLADIVRSTNLLYLLKHLTYISSAYGFISVSVDTSATGLSGDSMLDQK